MTVKQRILTVRLMTKAKQDPRYAKRLKIDVVYGEQKKEERK